MIPKDWTLQSMHGWQLGTCPTLHLARRRHIPSGTELWLIGYPIELSLLRWCAASTDDAIPDGVEVDEYLDTLAGRWIAIIFAGESERLRLDASGSLATVYSLDLKVVASTLMLVPRSPEDQDDRELITSIDVANSNRYFAFGSTARTRVRQLLPNHCLDLRDWCTVRHWPRGPFPIVADTTNAVQKIAASLEATISVVCGMSSPYMSLTDGRDSRMLLACVRERTAVISFFTWQIPGPVGASDVKVAKRLARKFQLRHAVIPHRTASPAMQSLWLYRTGCTVGELAGMRGASVHASQDASRPYLPGLASELARGFFWRDSDKPEQMLSGEELLQRMGLPHVPQLVYAARAWLSELRAFNRLELLDLAYIEQRLACWAAVHAYGACEGPYWLLPISDRRIFEQMLSLPYDFRRASRLQEAIIGRAWPELLSVPFSPLTLRLRVNRFLKRMPILWRLAESGA